MRVAAAAVLRLVLALEARAVVVRDHLLVLERQEQPILAVAVVVVLLQVLALEARAVQASSSFPTLAHNVAQAVR